MCEYDHVCLHLLQRGQVADELVNRTLENAEADQRTTDTSEDQEDHEEDSPLITGHYDTILYHITILSSTYADDRSH